MKAQQQPDERELVINHLQNLLIEREKTIRSLTLQLNSVKMSAGRLALRKLMMLYERLSKAASEPPTLTGALTRPEGDRLNGAGPESAARAESLDVAKALLNRSRAALEELRGDDVRAIAFYLPQFHPIPENDLWWGKGFTEWTNVTKARPNFEGHYQPHLPADLGFYDLRVPEVREQQAELAREYGIHGFCYYHYWFSGRRLLERPFNETLSSGRPDFPFCLLWANHNWTRCWEGGENEILIEQHYSVEDDRNFIRNLFPAFEDRRYIRINGKPLLIVFRADILPDAGRTAAIWREEMKNAGLGEIYLCLAQTKGSLDPRLHGFDGAVEFQPNNATIKKLDAQIAKINPYFAGTVRDYMINANAMIHAPKPDYTLFKAVMTGWDNTPRRQDTGLIYVNSSPEAYEYWLGKAVEHMITHYKGDERIVFVNAWNEWAEGAHLEPDRRYGRRHLEATRNVMSVAQGNRGMALDERGRESGLYQLWKQISI
jgi:lipopolysaccharide biosynthesis protein